MIWRRKKTSESDRIIEEMIKSTKNQLKELSFSYEKLGQTLKKMPVCHWSLQEEEILNIVGRISMEACEGCSRFYQCYRQEKGELIEEVERILSYLEQNGTGERKDLTEAFCEKCMRSEKFLDVLIQSYEIVGIHRSWKNKMLYQRKLMAAQMEEMSRLLFDCSVRMGYDKKGDQRLEKRIKKQLKDENIIVKTIGFYENTSKKKELFLIARKKGKSCSADYLAKVLSNVLKLPLVPARDCKMTLYGEDELLHFKEDVSFQLLSGMAYRIKEGEQVSGDLFSILKQEQGKQIYLLADGMGSGEMAREEGSQMMELMEQLLATGFHEEETVKLANSTFTFGVERSMYSSVDLLSINLYTGLMKIIKSGSAATFFVQGDRVEVMQSKSLPAGFLWEVEFDVVYKKLYDGDRVVLVSDGVLDCISKGQPEEELKKIVTIACRGNSQQAAEQILEQALLRNQNRAEDDMTVLVLSVWKKSRR